MANEGKRWSKSDQTEVINLLLKGEQLDKVANSFERSQNSILWQVIKYIENNDNHIPDCFSKEVYEFLENIPYYCNHIKVKKNLIKILDEAVESEASESEAADEAAEEAEEAEEADEADEDADEDAEETDEEADEDVDDNPIIIDADRPNEKIIINITINTIQKLIIYKR